MPRLVKQSKCQDPVRLWNCHAVAVTLNQSTTAGVSKIKVNFKVVEVLNYIFTNEVFVSALWFYAEYVFQGKISPPPPFPPRQTTTHKINVKRKNLDCNCIIVKQLTANL